MSRGQVIVLGINGHVGHHIAKAFVAGGWEVSGMGRSNRHPIDGVRFVKGDADSLEDLRAAIGSIDVVVNALNLPYDKWGNGAMEAQNAISSPFANTGVNTHISGAWGEPPS